MKILPAAYAEAVQTRSELCARLGATQHCSELPLLPWRRSPREFGGGG